MRCLFFPFIAAIFSLFSSLVFAQPIDSVFDTYDDYAAFVDEHIMARDMVPMLNRIGGRDELTPEEMQGFQKQINDIYRRDFEDVAVAKSIDLGNGFRQEMRVYWRGSTGYFFFYAFLHERDDATVVLNFAVNSSSKAILKYF